MLIVTVWKGYTLTPVRTRRFRCEANWQKDRGLLQQFVSYQTTREILQLTVSLLGAPMTDVYDWEWAGPAGEFSVPGCNGEYGALYVIEYEYENPCAQIATAGVAAAALSGQRPAMLLPRPNK